MQLMLVDWIIALAMIGGLVGAGLYGRRLVRSVAQFTVAGRGMGVWLGLSTGAAESMGLFSIVLGIQAGYTSGFSWIWVSTITTTMYIVLFGILGLGIMRYRTTNVQTLPQYFEMRYSRAVRIFAGITLALGGVLNMALFPIVESNFLIAFLGFPAHFHFLGLTLATFPLALVSLLTMAIFFTTIGGMVSITIVEYIQAAVMSVTLTLITIILIVKAGGGSFISGLGHITDALESNVGDAGFNPFAKNSLGVAFVIAMLLGSFIQRLSFPPALQKQSSAKTPKIVRLGFLLSGIFGLGRSIIFNLWGIAALVLIGTVVPAGQDPEQYHRIFGGIMLRNAIPPSLTGIALASFIFASVSTTNIYLLSWSTVITNDVVCAIRKRPFSPEKHIRVLRLVCLGIALFIICWGLYYKPSEHILQWLVITGAILGGAGLITWFGLYWRRATTAGAWSALVSSVIICIGWIFVQQQFPDLLKASEHSALGRYINQDNVGLFATVFPAVLLVMVSLLTKPTTRFVDYGKRLKEIKAREDALAEASEEQTLKPLPEGVA